MKNLSTEVGYILLGTWAVVAVSSASEIAPTQSPAAAECTDRVYGMMDCMGFLIVGGSETTPQGSCCSGLKSLVEFNADCVCYAVTLAPTLGLDLDIHRARALPSLCRLPAPQFTTCHLSNYGGADGSPANAPAPATIIGKSPGSAPANLVGESAPAPAPSSSSSVALPAIFLEFLFIIVSVLFFVNY
ncbi:hypothetical protein C2S53_015187 [Perilla frutescens var. hirtella]|uniref:Bifunctional inhibitor/plant lipid transfer protein/seed storage helical domain-containing protein n=1 Tax=Perilla frutescens var. hirtella TaxID=608512 RepID=A0AAD4P6B0_PERFH|nr:hypothetical protein C2S53_015187 [Perilla frutescens var. hirtella]